MTATPASFTNTQQQASTPTSRRWATSDLVIGLVVLAGAIWCYWATLVGLWKEWRNDDNYSVGRLVPLMAIYVLFQERHAFAKIAPKTFWPGLLVMGAAIWMRDESMRSLYESFERYSFVLMIAGITLFLCGLRVAWRAKWIIAFLALMIPLPGKVHNKIAGPLQDYAVAGTVFALELFGVSVNPGRQRADAQWHHAGQYR